jgi:hypothetical protein
LSDEHDKTDPDEVIPWVTKFKLDDLPLMTVDDPETGKCFTITRETMGGALVAYAMELQEALGMPFKPPQEAVEEMGLSWDKVQLALPVFKKLAGELDKGPGRPKKTTDDRWDHPGTRRVMDAVRDYLYDNPGAVRRNSATKRTVYSDGFREFVLKLVGPEGAGAGMTGAQAEAVIGVSASTISAWRSQKKGKRRRRRKK